jgi:hypothetical protein
MNQPNLQEMSRKELHAYVLAHREDQDAFYVYVDRLHAEATWIDMPALQSAEDLDNYPEFVARFRSGSEPQDKAI